MKTTTLGMTKRIVPFVVLLALMWSCDMFENDVVPDENDITLGETDFYTLPNTSAVIDLKSLVKSYTQFSLTITDQPKHGDLESVTDAVFTYKPDTDFKGRDYFLFDVKSNGKIVLSDSIIITVDQDTTSFPCGLYAVHDSVTILYRPGPYFGVPIQVLDNDYICGIDKTEVDVTIFSHPSHGVVSVVEVSPLEVRYTAEAGFSGDDHFIYKISDPSDTSVYSLALVTVSVAGGPCTSTLRDDYALFDRIGSMKIYNVFENDSICSLDSLNDEFNIIDGPNTGQVMIDGTMGIVRYLADPLFGYRADSVIYEYCHNDVCQTAKLRIAFEEDCHSALHADSVSLPLGTALPEININVLSNDVICDGVELLLIVHAPSNGTATVVGDMIHYQADSPTSPSDSLTYKVCNTVGACATADVFIKRE